MGWLLLAAAAVAVFLFAKKSGASFETFQNDATTGGVPGTWGFRATVGAHGITDNGPYASQVAAATAAAQWLAENAELPPNIVTPIPDPIPIPEAEPGQQGIVLPYLVITGGGLSGSAVVEGSKVRWTIAGESALAGSVSTANATLLQRFDTKVPDNDDIGISLTRSTGQIVRARVRREPAQVVPWAWEVFIGGASQKRAFWRANTRIAAMRGALSTLQDS